ncbi:MAG: hypothetical protein ACR2LK_04935, partial [Solirubrobacteraceae bacterium]
ENRTIRWRTHQFRLSLDHLNRPLDHLSFAAHSWAIGALERRDLPPVLPVLLQSTHADHEGRVRGSTFGIPIHDDYPLLASDVEDTPIDDAGALQHAVDVATASNHGALPFEQVFRFLRAADSERIGGDPTRSVVDLATAMELLFFQVLLCGGPAAGWDTARVARATGDRTPLRGRVEQHVGPLLGATVDVMDTTTVWGCWWERGYLRRNWAVHHGRRVTEEDCQRAWEAAADLIEHITKVLDLQPVLGHLSIALGELGLGRSKPPWLDQRLPIPIDWF